MKESVPAKTRTYVLGAVAAAALVLSAIAFWMSSQTPVVAYVDSAVLLERYVGAIEARATLQAQLDIWETNLDTLRQEAAGFGDQLLRDDLSRAEREAASDRLEAKQRELAQYAEAVGRQAADREQQVLQPVYSELNA
ncbi:MAG: OmpH family outer membrane protein, partial [Bacteroidota bacterium]